MRAIAGLGDAGGRRTTIELTIERCGRRLRELLAVKPGEIYQAVEFAKIASRFAEQRLELRGIATGACLDHHIAAGLQLLRQLIRKRR